MNTKKYLFKKITKKTTNQNLNRIDQWIHRLTERLQSYKELFCLHVVSGVLDSILVYGQLSDPISKSKSGDRKYDSKIVVNFYCTFNYWTNATGCIDIFMSRRTTGLFLVRLYEQSVRFNNYVNPRVCGKDICPWANRSWLSAIWNPRGDRMQIRRRVQSWTNASRSERLALLIKWSIRHKNISLKNWVNALLYNK